MYAAVHVAKSCSICVYNSLKALQSYCHLLPQEDSNTLSSDMNDVIDDLIFKPKVTTSSEIYTLYRFIYKCVF